MSVHGCFLLAIEGSHASGKTTLVHALTAHYRERGLLVDATGEPARVSPFIDDIVLHDQGDFDLVTEVDLFGAHLSATLRAARHQRLLVCDKTIVNVLAYARLVLNTRRDSREAAVLDAMAAFCRTWAPISYDAVFYLPDHYQQPQDPLRSKVAHLQQATANAIRNTYADLGLDLTDVPAGMTTAARVTWIAQRVEPLLTEQSDYRQPA